MAAPRQIIEECLDCSLEHFRHATHEEQLRLVERAYAAQTISGLQRRLHESYSAAGSTVAVDEWEVAPALYSLHSYGMATVGASTARDLPATGLVKPTLLYAHRLVLPDPLLSVRYYNAPTATSHPVHQMYGDQIRIRELNALWHAVELWVATYELVDASIVVMVPPPRRPTTTLWQRIESLREENEAFAASLDEVAPFPVEPDDDFTLFELATDLESDAAMRSQCPGTDQWLPSAPHLELYVRLVRASLQDASGGVRDALAMSRLLSLTTPDLEALTMADIRAIRLGSDVFDRWRRDLSSALEESASISLDETSRRAEFRRAMSALASRTEREIGTSFGISLRGAVRSVTIGIAAAGVGGALGGWSGVLSGAAGGLAEVLLSEGAAATSRRRLQRARKALHRHALLLS